MGNKYGWMGALERDYTDPGISGAAFTDVIKEEQESNGKAVTYLVLSCTTFWFLRELNSVQT
jgi:hypothetical protein